MRVAPGSHTDKSQYQYWSGSEFNKTPLTYPNFNGWAPAAVMVNAPQGSISYNSYYNQYIYLYPGAALSGRKFHSNFLLGDIYIGFFELKSYRDSCGNVVCSEWTMVEPSRCLSGKHDLLCSCFATPFRY